MELYLEYNISVDFKERSTSISFQNSTRGLKDDTPVHKHFTHPKTNFKLSSKDKLYFLPGTNVPRAKLKDTFSKLKIVSTKDIDNTDKFIVSGSTYDKLFESRYARFYKVSFIQKVLKLLDKIGYFVDEYDLEQFNEALENYESEYIICNNLYFLTQSTIKNQLSNILDATIIEKINQINGSSWTSMTCLKKKENYDLYEKIMSSKLYSERTLLRDINGDDSVTINEEIFENLCEMLESSDEDNHTVAAEIMANSDYESSISYILLLIHKYYYSLYLTKGSKHVNFKSLLSFLNLSLNYAVTHEQCIKTLKDTNTLTEEHIKNIFKFFAENHKMNNTVLFNTPVLKLSPELSEHIGKEIVYNFETKTITEHELVPKPTGA